MNQIYNVLTVISKNYEYIGKQSLNVMYLPNLSTTYIKTVSLVTLELYNYS